MKNADEKSFLEYSKKDINNSHEPKNIIGRIKLNLFNILNLCLNYSNYSGIELIVVATFESFQFLYFLFLKIFADEWTIQTSNKLYLNIHKILRCLLIFPDFRDSSYSFFIICLFFGFFFNIGILFLFILIGYLLKKKIKIPSSLIKSLSNLINIYNSILLIPLLVIFLPFFHCESFIEYRNDTLKIDNSFCKKGKQKFFICIAIIGFSLSIIYSFIFSTLFYNISIQYNNYLGRINPIFNIYATFVKIFVTILGEFFIYEIGNSNTNNQLLISGFYLILFLFFYIVNKLSANFYLDITKKVYDIITISLLYTSICLFFRTVLIKFKFTNFDGFFQLWVIILLFIIIFQVFYPNNKEQIMNKLPKDITNPKESLEYILVMLKFFIYNEKKENLKMFKHFIKKHLFICNEEFCYLKQYKKEVLDMKKINKKNKNLNDNNNVQQNNNKKNDDNQILFKYLDYIFQYFLNKFPNNNTLKLFFCIFSLEKRNKLNITKYYLQSVLENKPKLYQEFIIFQIQKKIESKNSNFSDDIFTVDITNQLVYDKYLNQFQTQIEILAHNYQEFWKIFAVEDTHNLNILKIEENGFKVLNNINQIFYLWKKIKKLIQNPKEAKILYGKFIIDIMSDEILGQELIDESKKITLNYHNHSYQLFKNDINNISIDGSPVIIAKASQNYENLRIVQITNSILRVFGYVKNDLLNHDINILLPKIFRKTHSEIVKNYIYSNLDFKKIKSRKINSFALHRMGYIFPVRIQFILLPTLIHNFLYAAKFKNESEREYNYQGYAIINQRLDFINISSQCLKLFNFSSNVFYHIKNPKKVKSERINLKNCIQELSPQIISSLLGKSSRQLTQRYNNEKNNITINNINEKNTNELSSRHNEIHLIKKYIDEPDSLVHLYNYEQIVNILNDIYSDNTDRTQKNNDKSNNEKNNNNLNIENIDKSNINNKSGRGSISISSGKIIRVDTKKSSSYINNIKGNNNNNNIHTIPVLININEILLKNISIGYYLVTCEYSFRNNILKSPSIGIKKNNFKSYNISNKFKYYNDQVIVFDYNIGFIIENKNNIFKYSFNEYLKKKEKKDNERIKSFSYLNLPKISNFHDFNLTFHKNINKDSQITSNKDSPKTSNKDSINSPINNLKDSINISPQNNSNNSPSKSNKNENENEKNNFLEDDLHKNDDENLNLENKEKVNSNDVTKCEINKLKIFQNKKKWEQLFIFNILNKIIFLGVIICIIFSSTFYVISNSYFIKSKKNIKGLYYISQLFNYTLSSTNYFINQQIYLKSTNINNQTKESLFQNLSIILLNNSNYIYNILINNGLILTEILDKIEQRNVDEDKNPNLMLLQYLLYYSDDIPVYENRNFSFIEANNEFMSSINSISNNINNDIENENLNETKAFFLCYNSINNYYIKVFDVILEIIDIMNYLFPKKSFYFLFFLFLIFNIFLLSVYFIKSKNLIIKFNQIILEFLSIKNIEFQIILKICSDFVKKVKKDSNYEFEMNEEDDNKLKERKKKINDDKKSNKEFVEEKMDILKKKIALKLFFILLGVLIIFEIFYLITYFQIYKYENNIKNYINVYYSILVFYSNLNLINIALKLELISNNIFPLLNSTMNTTLNERFIYYLTMQDNLTYYLETRQKYSSNFTNYYNKNIMLYYLPLINIIITDTGNNDLCKDLNEYSLNYAISEYYVNLNDLWNYYQNQNKNVIEHYYLNCADLIKDRIIIPYFKLMFDSLYIDGIETCNNNKQIILICFTLFLICLFILTIGIGIPVNHFLYKKNEKIKFLILLIPTKILINKKSLLEILKNEQMISLKK